MNLQLLFDSQIFGFFQTYHRMIPLSADLDTYRVHPRMNCGEWAMSESKIEAAIAQTCQNIEYRSLLVRHYPMRSSSNSGPVCDSSDHQWWSVGAFDCIFSWGKLSKSMKRRAKVLKARDKIETAPIKRIVLVRIRCLCKQTQLVRTCMESLVTSIGFGQANGWLIILKLKRIILLLVCFVCFYELLQSMFLEKQQEK